MKVVIKRKRPEQPNRQGPGLGFGYAHAMANKIQAERRIKEEKKAYAETHDGRKVPRRKKA